jgi:hypothetical protein
MGSLALHAFCSSYSLICLLLKVTTPFKVYLCLEAGGNGEARHGIALALVVSNKTVHEQHTWCPYSLNQNNMRGSKEMPTDPACFVVAWPRPQQLRCFCSAVGPQVTSFIFLRFLSVMVQCGFVFLQELAITCKVEAIWISHCLCH